MDSILYTSTFVGLAALTAVMYVLVVHQLRRALEKAPWEEPRRRKVFGRAVISLIGWTLLISALGLSGFLADFAVLPPRIMLVLIVPLITMITLTFSKTTTELLGYIPSRNLAAFQVFRVFVEIILWMAFIQNLLPVQMTFEGRNFDIIAGLTAPLAAYFLAKSRKGLIIWNLFSLLLLFNIVTVAVLSLPTPLRAFMNEPANTIVATFPFVWLPGLLVPLAYGLHFLSLRQLSTHGIVDH
ncbi:MAG: hypothetical protein JST46_14285 [Bacteroidetes bacterium]|nr:hypothetical protein [Bacteroidota bacterium]